MLYDNLIKLWTEQLDMLVQELFKGESEHIKQLSTIISGGQMIDGSLNGHAANVQNHTDSFLQEGAAERAFYAAAIPSVWKMRKPYPMYPVILDFGPDCGRHLDSGDYFHSGEDFNKGWVCVDGYNYILAGTYDRNNDGPNCLPEYYTWCLNPQPGWAPLFTLPGLGEIQKPDLKFGKQLSIFLEDYLLTWRLHR